jgi:hypothetical protein
MKEKRRFFWEFFSQNDYRKMAKKYKFRVLLACSLLFFIKRELSASSCLK